mgnify:CR=1 FL=1
MRASTSFAKTITALTEIKRRELAPCPPMFAVRLTLIGERPDKPKEGEKRLTIFLTKDEARELAAELEQMSL